MEQKEKEQFFKALTHNASKKIEIEYAMARETNTNPEFDWIEEDIRKLLDRVSIPWEDYLVWCSQRGIGNIQILFDTNHYAKGLQRI